MKRLFIIICVLLVAASCNGLEGPDGPGAQNPLNECVLPSVVQAGDEALIQWNGFTQASRILLVSESGMETEVSIKVLTNSGIMFVVPASMPAGSYVVVLEQDGRKELGTIQVTAADMPVTGIKIPSSIIVGEEMMIEGIGFEEGCSIIMVSEDGKELIIKTGLTSTGITLILPEDIVPGNYTIYLYQDGATWLISDSFAVYGGSKEQKLLQRIDYYTPYTGDEMLKLSWEINHDDPVSLKLSEYIVDGSGETLQVYDLYESKGDLCFELTHDGFESSNDLSMSYIIDSEGTVQSSDVLIYGNAKTTAFTWTYDADGYLTDISSPARSFRSLEYTDRNLTTFRNTSFEYGDAELVNHPFAPDVVWAYMALMEYNDPFVYFPFFLGWNIKSSAQLPDALILPSPTGTGTIRNELSYVFDEDGYVVKMAWDASEIGFIY